MKITKLSLAAVAAMAMTTGAMAADKGVDFNIGGQAVVYYQTSESGGNSDFFNQGNAADGTVGNSKANVGVQLNANADLGNGFGLGLQGTALGTLGLEKNLVSNTMQSAEGGLNGMAVTKAYVTKQLANTTLKLGRQELPKSLSPLAFSESWNVFKNTFDAAVAINTDIPNTTLVGAYVANSNNHADLSSFDNLTAVGGVARPGNGAYMLTALNKGIENVALTGSYYSIISGGATAPGTIAPHVDALWLDVAASKLGPVNVGLQAGQLSPDGATFKDTSTFGAKVTGNAGNVALKLAYTTVDDGTLSVQNVGTGVKTPLFTQMVANQNFISTDNDTVLLQAAMPVAAGKVIAQYGMTNNNATNGKDFNEFDLIYKFKALGTNVLAAYVRADSDAANDPTNIIRLWTRYNF